MKVWWDFKELRSLFPAGGKTEGEPHDKNTAKEKCPRFNSLHRGVPSREKKRTEQTRTKAVEVQRSPL